jgi:hypothetical protein
MKSRLSLLITLHSLLATSPAFSADASVKEQLLGSWAFVSSITTRPDGTKLDAYGPNSNGIATFSPDGHFSIIIVRTDLEKFKTNNRLEGSTEENKAVVQGTNAYFGTYTVDEPKKHYDAKIEGATFPNWNGTIQRRRVSFEGDRLVLSNEAGSAGGAAEITWRRFK